MYIRIRLITVAVGLMACHLPAAAQSVGALRYRRDRVEARIADFDARAQRLQDLLTEVRAGLASPQESPASGIEPVIKELKTSLEQLVQKVGTLEEDLSSMADENPGIPEYQSLASHVESLVDEVRALMSRDLQHAHETGESVAPATSTEAVPTSPMPDAEDEAPQIVEPESRVKVFGDLRLRHESNIRLVGKPDRHRERMRVRFGASFELSPELEIGGRITTGSLTDPASPHRDLGKSFDRFQVALDRAFLTYRPNWAEGAKVTFGKFSHPFFRSPIFGELVWDADIQPEGVVVGYTGRGSGSLDRISVRAGQYLLLEQSSGSEASLTAAQAHGRVTPVDDLAIDVAASIYAYGEVVPDGNPFILNRNRGNATVDVDDDGTADRFLSEFTLFNPIVSATYFGGITPVTLTGEYVLNSGADERNHGFAVGASIGGSARFYYQWQSVQQDAVFSPFVQDDFLMATNHRSHVTGVQFAVGAKTNINVWALISSYEEDLGALSPGQDRWRLRFDVNTSF